MARNKGNQVMKNVRGMFNKQVVFKERLGTPYVAGPPSVNENRKPMQEEQANRNSFADAVEFGKKAVKDPALKQEYAALAKQGQTAYNVAVSDARLPPKIHSLLAQGYTGKIGSCILIHATDNVKVKSVKILIHDNVKNVVEEGNAQDTGDGFNWIYTATIENHNLEGCIVEALAFDIAGNVTAGSVRM